jgi:hypothetical protein
VEDYQSLSVEGKQMNDHVRSLAEYFAEDPAVIELVITRSLKPNHTPSLQQVRGRTSGL